MNTKLVKTIREAIALAGLKDGMTISFHHHLRNGDYVLNLVMDEIAAMGIRDLTVNASALFDTHAPLLDHIKNHVVRKVQTNYISAGIGRQISAGLMDEPVEFRTHGGRPRDIALGITPIDVAFIAAPCSDRMGNCTGKYGRSACGSLGYAFPDAMYAKKVVVITDELAEYPLTGWSIPEIYVDYVVQIDAIGDPAGIVSGTTRMTRNPVALVMAQTAARVNPRIPGFCVTASRSRPAPAAQRLPRPCISSRSCSVSRSTAATRRAALPGIWSICSTRAASGR